MKPEFGLFGEIMHNAVLLFKKVIIEVLQYDFTNTITFLLDFHVCFQKISYIKIMNIASASVI